MARRSTSPARASRTPRAWSRRCCWRPVWQPCVCRNGRGPPPVYDRRGDTVMPRYTVLFDGGCPMCRRTVRVLRRLDWLRRLTFVDATDAAARERLAPGLTEAEVLVEMYVVAESGARAAGFDG